MKNLFKLFVPVAAAAIALVSCQPKEEQIGNDPAGEITIRVHATANDLKSDDPEVKTYIDDTNTIIWGTGEYMKLALTAGESTIFANSTDASADIFNGDPEAMFEFSVSPATASEYVYQGIYPASAAATTDNDKVANYKVNLPAIQNATASSYDPAAYIMVAKPESFDAVQTDWEASFRRGTALNKMTLKNVPSGVSFNKVKITAEGKKLAGGRHFDLTNGVGSDVYGSEATIEVLYATPISGSSVNVWFTSWDAEIAAGEKLTVVAYTTDNKSYTKEITVPSGRSIKLQEEYLNKFGVSLEGITAQDVTTISGDYVILAKKDDSTFYALKGEASGTRIASVNYSGSLSSYNGDSSIVWTIATSGTDYTIKNGGNFIGWTGGSGSDANNAALIAEADYDADKCLMGIDDNGDGTYKIYVAAETGRILARNQSNAYFAFYGNTQYKDIVLVPATALEQVATPTFDPAAGAVASGSTVTISCATPSATIHYTVDGTDPTTSSATYSSPITITSATTIKAIAVKSGMADSDVATAVYTIAGAPQSLPYSNNLTNSHEGFTFNVVSDGGLSAVWTDSNYGMQANGYQCTSSIEAYAESPLFDLTSVSGAKLTFTHGINYFADVATAKEQTALQVRVQNGTWQNVTIPDYPTALGNSTVTTNVDLSSYAGEIIQIRFKYLATTTNPGRWQIKNLNIVEVVPVTLSSIAVSGQTTEFVKGATFSFGGTVTATYSDSSSKDVTGDAEFTGYDMSTAGEQTVTVSYTEGSIVKTTTYTITVTEPGNVTEGVAWSYTFTASQWSSAGAVTLNEKSWTMAGTGGPYFGYDATKGQQFGSGSKPYSALTLTSNLGVNYGVREIRVSTSGASGISATMSVSVGGVDYECDSATSITLTASNTMYSFVSPDGNLKAGDIVISYNNSSSKAIYVKTIAVNPAPATKLTMSDITCTNHTSSSLTFGWSAVAGAVGYQVSTDGSTYGSIITALTYTMSGLNPETDYTIWVMAIGDGATYSNSDPKESATGTTDASSGSSSVVYDFTGSDWSVSNGTLTNGSVSFTGAGAANFKMNSGYFMMGKSGAYITFPEYSNSVSKIVVTGRSGASTSVVQNIFVDNTAVSTPTTGATGENTYEIDANYQTVGTIYKLQVTSGHNTQITRIEVFFN